LQWNGAAAVAARHCDVLLAALLIRHDAAGDRATGVEARQFLAAACVEHEQVAVQISREVLASAAIFLPPESNSDTTVVSQS